MAKSPYVFISYSRRDQELVDRLSRDLRQAGIEVWRDVEQIPAGTNWQRQIEDGMRGATALLYLASANSLQSEWMKSELQTFHQLKKPIIPVIVDQDAASNAPQQLQLAQWVDIRTDYKDGLARIVDAISSFIVRAHPIKSKATKSKGYVFLSYAEEDRDFVSPLKTFLRQHDYAYWDYDESDRDYHSQLFLDSKELSRNRLLP